MTGPDGDELRARALLLAQHARPFGHPETALMDDTPPQPERPRDWLDDILDATPGPQLEPDAQQREPDPGPADEPRRWWSVGRQPADEPAQPPQTPQFPGMPPGLHITFTPPPAPQPTNARQQERRARARRWFLIHAVAAGVGWAFGLYHSIAAFLGTLGPAAPATGIALAGMSWVAAALATERIVNRYVPSDELRRVAAWALRIPFATALLATALHAPNALY